jgi:hypothetical protein
MVVSHLDDVNRPRIFGKSLIAVRRIMANISVLRWTENNFVFRSGCWLMSPA